MPRRLDTMAVIDQVTEALAKGMKSQQTLRVAALRMLKTALMNKEVELKRALTAADEVQVVVSLVKQRRESIEQFEKGGRQELADREQAEILVLEEYLPAAVPEHEIARAMSEVIAETGATTPKDMGRVMKALTARFAGRPIDGKALSDLVRRSLGG
jgi:uncharacterized protein YqeY